MSTNKTTHSTHAGKPSTAKPSKSNARPAQAKPSTAKPSKSNARPAQAKAAPKPTRLGTAKPPSAAPGHRPGTGGAPIHQGHGQKPTAQPRNQGGHGGQSSGGHGGQSNRQSSGGNGRPNTGGKPSPVVFEYTLRQTTWKENPIAQFGYGLRDGAGVNPLTQPGCYRALSTPRKVGAAINAMVTVGTAPMNAAAALAFVRGVAILGVRGVLAAAGAGKAVVAAARTGGLAKATEVTVAGARQLASGTRQLAGAGAQLAKAAYRYVRTTPIATQAAALKATLNHAQDSSLDMLKPNLANTRLDNLPNAKPRIPRLRGGRNPVTRQAPAAKLQPTGRPANRPGSGRIGDNTQGGSLKPQPTRSTKPTTGRTGIPVVPRKAQAPAAKLQPTGRPANRPGSGRIGDNVQGGSLKPQPTRSTKPTTGRTGIPVVTEKAQAHQVSWNPKAQHPSTPGKSSTGHQIPGVTTPQGKYDGGRQLTPKGVQQLSPSPIKSNRIVPRPGPVDSDEDILASGLAKQSLHSRRKNLGRQVVAVAEERARLGEIRTPAQYRRLTTADGNTTKPLKGRRTINYDSHNSIPAFKSRPAEQDTQKPRFRRVGSRVPNVNTPKRLQIQANSQAPLSSERKQFLATRKKPVPRRTIIDPSGNTSKVTVKKHRTGKIRRKFLSQIKEGRRDFALNSPVGRNLFRKAGMHSVEGKILNKVAKDNHLEIAVEEGAQNRQNHLVLPAKRGLSTGGAKAKHVKDLRLKNIRHEVSTSSDGTGSVENADMDIFAALKLPDNHLDKPVLIEDDGPIPTDFMRLVAAPINKAYTRLYHPETGLTLASPVTHGPTVFGSKKQIPNLGYKYDDSYSMVFKGDEDIIRLADGTAKTVARARRANNRQLLLEIFEKNPQEHIDTLKHSIASLSEQNQLWFAEQAMKKMNPDSQTWFIGKMATLVKDPLQKQRLLLDTVRDKPQNISQLGDAIRTMSSDEQLSFVREAIKTIPVDEDKTAFIGQLAREVHDPSQRRQLLEVLFSVIEP
jgi:hypothetical protein